MRKLIIPIVIALAIPLMVRAEEPKKEIDFSKYIIKEEKDIYSEVYGEDNGTDFVPGYYETIIDESIPLTPEEQLSIQHICEQYQISYELVLAIIETESRYKADAVNPNGTCKGLMQINTSLHECEEPFNAIENVKTGVKYLSELFEEYNDVGLVLDLYGGYDFTYYNKGEVSRYTENILRRSEEFERVHRK